MTGAGMDVLVPTYRRPAALAVTLAGLAAQRLPAYLDDVRRTPASNREEVGRPAQ